MLSSLTTDKQKSVPPPRLIKNGVYPTSGSPELSPGLALEQALFEPIRHATLAQLVTFTSSNGFSNLAGSAFNIINTVPVFRHRPMDTATIALLTSVFARSSASSDEAAFAAVMLSMWWYQSLEDEFLRLASARGLSKTDQAIDRNQFWDIIVSAAKADTTIPSQDMAVVQRVITHPLMLPCFIQPSLLEQMLLIATISTLADETSAGFTFQVPLVVQKVTAGDGSLLSELKKKIGDASTFLSELALFIEKPNVDTLSSLVSGVKRAVPHEHSNRNRDEATSQPVEPLLWLTSKVGEWSQIMTTTLLDWHTEGVIEVDVPTTISRWFASDADVIRLVISLVDHKRLIPSLSAMIASDYTEYFVAFGDIFLTGTSLVADTYARVSALPKLTLAENAIKLIDRVPIEERRKITSYLPVLKKNSSL